MTKQTGGPQKTIFLFQNHFSKRVCTILMHLAQSLCEDCWREAVAASCNLSPSLEDPFLQFQLAATCFRVWDLKFSTESLMCERGRGRVITDRIFLSYLTQSASCEEHRPSINFSMEVIIWSVFFSSDPEASMVESIRGAISPYRHAALGALNRKTWGSIKALDRPCGTWKCPPIG